MIFRHVGDVRRGVLSASTFTRVKVVDVIWNQMSIVRGWRTPGGESNRLRSPVVTAAMDVVPMNVLANRQRHRVIQAAQNHPFPWKQVICWPPETPRRKARIPAGN